MIDMTQTILAKSDQLNADDLFGGSITVKITKVGLASAEQPIAVNYEGDNNKPYYPCKSMRRVMVHVWGKDGNKYVGRSLTLYRDEKVVFGGAAVGGIRISHMSDISEPITMSLTASKKSKKPFTVLPLGDVKPVEKVTPEQKKAAAQKKATAITLDVKMAKTPEELKAILADNADAIKRLEGGYSDLAEAIAAAVAEKEFSFEDGEEEELPL